MLIIINLNLLFLNWTLSTVVLRIWNQQAPNLYQRPTSQALTSLNVLCWVYPAQGSPNPLFMDPKKEEMDPKKEETGQQTENLQLFLKIRKQTQTKVETDPKKRKQIKCKYSRNQPKIFKNPSILFGFWGISDNSWKRRKRTQTHFWSFSMLRHFHSTKIVCKYIFV